MGVTWYGHISMRAGLLSGSDPASTWLAGPEPSIALDLGTAVDVAYVAVYNRRDCCQDRLADYTVSYRVHSTDAWTVCAEATAAADAVGPLLSECPQLAQYVRVQLPGAGRVLNLAEIEVYSFPPPPLPPSPPPFTTKASLKTAVQAYNADPTAA